MGRRKILLPLAAVIAALGTLMVFLYVQGAEGRAEEEFDAVEVLARRQADRARRDVRRRRRPASSSCKNVPKDRAARRLPDRPRPGSRAGGHPDDLRRRADHRRQVGWRGRGRRDVAGHSQGHDGDLGQPHRPGARVRLREPRAPRSPIFVTYSRIVDSTPCSASSTASRCWASAPRRRSPPPRRRRTASPTTEEIPQTLMTLAVNQKDAQRVFYGAANGELSVGLLTKDTTGYQDRAHDRAEPLPVRSAHARHHRPRPEAVEALMPRLPPGTHGVNNGEKLDAWLTHRTDEYAVVLGPNGPARRGHPRSARGCATPGRRPAWSSSAPSSTRTCSTAPCRPGVGTSCGSRTRPASSDAVSRAHQLWLALHGGSVGTAAAATSSPSSPPRAASARPPPRSTSPWPSPTTARGGCAWSTSTSRSVTSRSPCSCSRRTPSRRPSAPRSLLDYSMVEGLLTRHEQSLMVLAAPAGPDAREAIRHALLGG